MKEHLEYFKLQGLSLLILAITQPEVGSQPLTVNARYIMTTQLIDSQGVRVAIEGCGHGALHAIYASIDESCKARGWDGVDVVLIGGDFQAVRNAADLNSMAVPLKYRKLGDFPEYYSGRSKAPYLTLFVGGNHEAASHLWELYYGGWVAPNIYYLGAANVVRVGPLRIAGMTGIWKGFDYKKTHHERLPFSGDDVRSFYHVREVDVRKLLQLRTQVDIGMSHDWPRLIERHGDEKWLFRVKRAFEKESYDGTLGNPAATYVMDRLRPPYWFSAHMHCKFSAVKKYPPPTGGQEKAEDTTQPPVPPASADEPEPIADPLANPDEIDLDMDDDAPAAPQPKEPSSTTEPSPAVADDVRAQLPASFNKPKVEKKGTPGQPVPAGITNQEVRFLALDKCLPGRHFLQLCEIQPHDPSESARHPSSSSPTPDTPRYRFQYDPEWLAITRVFSRELTIGDAAAPHPPDLGESHYAPLIDAELAWVTENIVARNKLDVPDNFAVTAPPHEEGLPESVQDQPIEYTNPQTVAFCELLEVPNLWDASEVEREQRRMEGPAQTQWRGGRGGRGGGGRGGRRGGGGWGRGRGGRRGGWGKEN
ncbi:hypothetical protein jhhlp_002202 [Lomentospora prolificans]|uniref:Lariat debranching enzyme C-terminal domain-containing protein n=1 Tax=Lomentospora prolificans TaxID=41688 RepID=A0A2N3NDE7_9PEZI|nr:hypothetical protein jhhlp_002202 [Lomentospora prolificans]